MQQQNTIKPFSCVLAYCRHNNGIGQEGELPWPTIKKDMKHFASVTTSQEPFAHDAVDTAAKGVFFNSALGKQLTKLSLEQTEAAKSKETINAVIMGRKTWDSIPAKYRPLKGRLNVVLTKNSKEFLQNMTQEKSGEDGTTETMQAENLVVMEDFEDALVKLSADKGVNEIFVIGGASLYEQALTTHAAHCKLIIATRVNKKFDCDTFAPALEKNEAEDWPFAPLHISETYSQDNITFDFAFFGNTSLLASKPHLVPTKLFEKFPRHPELQYLETIDDVMRTGQYKDDRTGTGILTKFGAQMRYDLSQSFPVLTTKDVFWRGVAEELIWFVNGHTNAKLLSDKKIKIWDGNASREFLDNLGFLEREEWDLGPVYGFQWRHFGAAYDNMRSDYTGQGVDQLVECINQIKTNPNSRRIVMTAWNPSAIKDMALPPCHILAQFYVTGHDKPRLSCQMYQRSCDLGLGVPFNIASYALMTCMLAQICGLERGEFIHSLGDAHVYKNHIEPLQTQLERMPHPFPQLEIDSAIKTIEDFEFKHFKLVNYTHEKKIKMEMAV